MHGITSPSAAASRLCSIPSYLRQLGSERADKTNVCMGKLISRKENKRFGQYLTANDEIEAGECILIALPFVSIEYLIDKKKGGCFQCGKMLHLKIKCPHCDIQFCSKRCARSAIHQEKCDTTFDSNDGRIVRITTKLILNAISVIGDVKSLLQFARGVLVLGKKNKKCRPNYSAYYDLLTLKGEIKAENQSIAKRVVQILLNHPQFQSISLNTDDTKRVLFSMAYRHANTIMINSFQDDFNVSGGGLLRKVAMFDILSRFNHSCSPNVEHYIDDDEITYCVTTRRINKGEQLFINYVSTTEWKRPEDRQKYLKKVWNFQCRCQVCLNPVKTASQKL